MSRNYNPKHVDGSGRFHRVESMIKDNDFHDLDHRISFISRMYACDDETFDAIFENHTNTEEEVRNA